MSAALPPDRGHLLTEHRHERSHDLDALATRECVALMIEDHARVRDAVAHAADTLARFIDDLVPRFEKGGRLMYLGAGTSGRLGVLDASECPPTFQSDPAQVVGIIAGGDSALRRSSEGAEDDPDGACSALDELNLTANDMVLGIAAGGTTQYVLGALRIAKERTSGGAMTGLLTCVPIRHSRESGNPGDGRDAAPRTLDSRLRGNDVDHLIFLDTGPELLTGSTRLKAGSATKLVLNIISTTLFVRLGKVYSNLMVDLRATNAKLRDRALRILTELCSELDRSQAADLLDRAGGELKTAILMQRLDIEADAARSLLASTGNRLRPVLEGESKTR